MVRFRRVEKLKHGCSASSSSLLRCAEGSALGNCNISGCMAFVWLCYACDPMTGSCGATMPAADFSGNTAGPPLGPEHVHPSLHRCYTTYPRASSDPDLHEKLRGMNGLRERAFGNPVRAVHL